MNGVRFISPTGLVIRVAQYDGFGKKTGLWIEPEKNKIVKVASFSNEKAANAFIDYLTKFCSAVAKDGEHE